MNGTHPHGSACDPQIGFYPLVSNITDAQAQFTQVRVQKHSLGPDPKQPKPSSSSKGLSGGIKALIGVLCSVGGIVLIMLVVLLWVRRQRHQRYAKNLALKQQSADAKAAEALGPGGGAPGASGIGASESTNKAQGSTSAVLPAVPLSGRLSGESFHSLQSNWTGNQLEHARQVNFMNGVFDEEVGQPGDDDPATGAAAGVTADFGGRQGPTDSRAEGVTSVGIDSGNLDPNDPYRDAKKIKGAYLKKHPSFERQTHDPFETPASSPLDALAAGGGTSAVGLQPSSTLGAAGRAAPSSVGDELVNPFASESSSRSPTAENSTDSSHLGPPVLSSSSLSRAAADGATGPGSAAATATTADPQRGPTASAISGARPASSASTARSAYASVDEMHDLTSEPATQGALANIFAEVTPNVVAPSAAPVHPLARAAPATASAAASAATAESTSRPPLAAPAPATHQPSSPVRPAREVPASAARTEASSDVPARVPEPAPTSASAGSPAQAPTPAAASAPPPVQAWDPAPAPAHARAPVHALAPTPTPAPAQAPAQAQAPAFAPILVSASPVAGAARQSRPGSPLIPQDTAPSVSSPLRRQDGKQAEAPTSRAPSRYAPSSRSPAASLRRPSGPAPPRANMMSPPSLRATQVAPGPTEGAAGLPSVLSPDLFFDPMLLPPPMPTGTSGGANGALAHQLFRATAGTTSPFNPSGSVSGQSSGWVSPSQTFVPAQNVRMQPAFMRAEESGAVPFQQAGQSDDSL